MGYRGASLLAPLFLSGALAACSTTASLDSGPEAGNSPPSHDRTHITYSVPSSQPGGHADFCMRHPDECGPMRADVPRSLLTIGTFAALNEINTRVNKELIPVTDEQLYRQDEFWAYPVNLAGDCEDSVLEKRRLLHEEFGIPLENLLITVALEPNGDSHAVLTFAAQNDDGSPIDLILDNRRDEIIPSGETDLHFVKSQSPAHAGKWLAPVVAL